MSVHRIGAIAGWLSRKSSEKAKVYCDERKSSLIQIDSAGSSMRQDAIWALDHGEAIPNWWEVAMAYRCGYWQAIQDLRARFRLTERADDDR